MRPSAQPPGSTAVGRLLDRLDALASVLARRGDVLGLLGLGSTGADRQRLDEHSDLDVFVVVDDDAAATRYRSEATWWSQVAPVGFAFAHTHDGWKVLFGDGVFVESAIFTLPELRRLPFTGAALVWRRDDAPEDIAVPRVEPDRVHVPSDAHQVAEALTNLLVGLHRLQRGEVLSATRLIQVHAVDRVLTLLERSDERARRRQDVFAVERSAEAQHAGRDLPLVALVPGYQHNAAAAEAVLAWLRRNVPAHVDPVLGAAVDDLLAATRNGDSAGRTAPRGGPARPAARAHMRRRG